METLKSVNTGNCDLSEGLKIDSEELRIEFVRVYDDKENDLALAMNCSNG